MPRSFIIRSTFHSMPHRPGQSGMKATTLRLACVGRLEAGHKGQDILFEILARPTWLARRWHLNLYGDGPNKHGLMRLSDRLGLNDRVTFAGHVSAIEEVWSANHALIMPSRHEGLPLTIVEAMLCGRPVVATNVGGIKELIDDGVTGFLADAPTTDSVQNCVRAVLDKTNRTRRDRKGSSQENPRFGAQQSCRGICK